MRKMFLMKGCPGSGKTTLIREWGVEDLAVSRDSLRALYAPVMGAFGGSTRSLGSKVEKRISQLAREAVRARCELGATVFVDNTNHNSSAQRDYVRIAQEYGYEHIVVDVQGQLTVQGLASRVNSRPYNQMSEEVIRDFHRRHFNSGNFGDPRVISPDEVLDELVGEVLDLSGYRKVVVVGDVQSCAQELEAVVEQESRDEDVFYIFTGDLFDRGPDAHGVFNLVNRIGRDNCRLIMGNHDEHLYRVLGSASEDHYAQTRESVANLRAHRVSRAAIRRWVDRFVPYVDFTYRGRRFFACHGGVDVSRLNHDEQGRIQAGRIADVEFIQGTRSLDATHRGVGDYSAEVEGRLRDGVLASSVYDGLFHGHRNAEHYGLDEFAPSYNLESEVEYGGGLSYAVIDAAGVHPHKLVV